MGFVLSSSAGGSSYSSSGSYTSTGGSTGSYASTSASGSYVSGSGTYSSWSPSGSYTSGSGGSTTTSGSSSTHSSSLGCSSTSPTGSFISGSGTYSSWSASGSYTSGSDGGVTEISGGCVTVTGSSPAIVIHSGDLIVSGSSYLGDGVTDVVAITGQLTASRGMRLNGGITTGSFAGPGSYVGIDTNGLLVLSTAGGGGGISWDGSTANGIATFKDSDEATVESNLTFDGSTLTVTGDTTIDKNHTGGGDATVTGLQIDLDKTTATTSNNTMYGINIDMDNTTATNGTNYMYGIYCTPTLTHAADAGGGYVYGAHIDATAGTNGSGQAIAAYFKASGGDLNHGILVDCENGASNYDLRLRSSADNGDHFTIQVGAAGATTITTQDDDGAAADLTFTIDGDIILGPAGSDVLPDADNTRNFGSNAKRWAKIHGGEISGSGNLQIAGNASVEGNLGVTGSIRGRQIQITTHGYNVGGAGERLIPWYTNADNQPTSADYNNQMIAPAAGKLLRVIFRPETGQAGGSNTYVRLYKNGNTAADLKPASSPTLVTHEELECSANAATSNTFTFSGSAHFSAGEIIGVSIDPQTGPDDVNVTCFWEFDFTGI